MGGGKWSASAYNSSTRKKIDSGTAFGYARTAKASGKYEAHEKLDPTRLNKAGLNIRESRDNGTEISVPIVLGLDGTGSMGNIPHVVQEKLAGLFGLLVRKGYIAEGTPQLSIGMYGDAYTDRLPLQISQFEADNRFEEEGLNNLLHEGNGGGNSGETPALLWYYMNNHIVTDAWEKRKKKGYFFMIADEVNLALRESQVRKFLGINEPVGSLKTEDIVKELTDKWEVVILLINNSTAHWQSSEMFYSNLFGKNNVLIVENPENISEIIGAAIGVMENSDLDNTQLENDLLEIGTSSTVASETIKAVSRLGGNNRGVAKAEGSINLDL